VELMAAGLSVIEGGGDRRGTADGRRSEEISMAEVAARTDEMLRDIRVTMLGLQGAPASERARARWGLADSMRAGR
jgi:hypothetical protein